MKNERDANPPKAPMLKLARFFATGFGSGLIPKAPGTWGSLAAVLLLYPALELFPVLASSLGIFTLCAATSVIGIWSSIVVCEHKLLGSSKDPKEIVIDEFAGLYLTYFICGTSLPSLALGFIFFRLFDILKLPPIKQLEKLPSGWGIMIDDLAAGVYAGFTALALSALS